MLLFSVQRYLFPYFFSSLTILYFILDHFLLNNILSFLSLDYLNKKLIRFVCSKSQIIYNRIVFLLYNNHFLHFLIIQNLCCEIILKKSAPKKCGNYEIFFNYYIIFLFYVSYTFVKN